MLTFRHYNKDWHLPIDDNRLLISHNSDDEPYFTWSGCENCTDESGTRLGADVYDCTIRLHVHKKITTCTWTKQLCHKCLYEHSYGLGSWEE